MLLKAAYEGIILKIFLRGIWVLWFSWQPEELIWCHWRSIVCVVHYMIIYRDTIRLRSRASVEIKREVMSVFWR